MAQHSRFPSLTKPKPIELKYYSFPRMSEMHFSIFLFTFFFKSGLIFTFLLEKLQKHQRNYSSLFYMFNTFKSSEDKQ